MNSVASTMNNKNLYMCEFKAIPFPRYIQCSSNFHLLLSFIQWRLTHCFHRFFFCCLRLPLIWNWKVQEKCNAELKQKKNLNKERQTWKNLIECRLQTILPHHFIITKTIETISISFFYRLRMGKIIQLWRRDKTKPFSWKTFPMFQIPKTPDQTDGFDRVN